MKKKTNYDVIMQNMTVEISYTPYFMYGEHFDDLEWGDGNA